MLLKKVTRLARQPDISRYVFKEEGRRNGKFNPTQKKKEIFNRLNRKKILKKMNFI